MDYIKIFAKNEKELKSLIETRRVYSLDIRMEIGIVKFAILMKKKRKKERTDETEISDRKESEHLEKKKNRSNWDY